MSALDGLTTAVLPSHPRSRSRSHSRTSTLPRRRRQHSELRRRLAAKMRVSIDPPHARSRASARPFPDRISRGHTTGTRSARCNDESTVLVLAFYLRDSVGIIEGRPRDRCCADRAEIIGASGGPLSVYRQSRGVHDDDRLLLRLDRRVVAITPFLPRAVVVRSFVRSWPISASVKRSCDARMPDLAIHHHVVVGVMPLSRYSFAISAARLERLRRRIERVFPVHRHRRFDEAAALDVAQILAVDLALRPRVDQLHRRAC